MKKVKNWICSKCGTAGAVPASMFPVTCCGVTYDQPNLNSPGLLQKAANFARDAVAHVTGGGKLVDDHTRAWRLSQCEACPLFDAVNRNCTHPRCGCAMKAQRSIVDALGWAAKRCPIGRWDNPPPRFVTTADLARDTLLLLKGLPKQISGIAALPRSGLIPASILATSLHLPLFTLTHEGLRGTGCGWRLSDTVHTPRPGPLLVVDDTSMYGNAGKMARDFWAKFGDGRQAIYAAVYCSPPELHRHGPMPDLWAVDLPDPHILEWCLFNCGYARKMAFDFDGVLTVDGTEHPLYLPRKFEVPLIITGRFEHERERTVAWLATHGINAPRLIMFPGTAAERDEPGAIARYKAKHFADSGLEYFCESDAEQAKTIAQLTGKRVICPTVAKVF